MFGRCTEVFRDFESRFVVVVVVVGVVVVVVVVVVAAVYVALVLIREVRLLLLRDRLVNGRRHD